VGGGTIGHLDLFLFDIQENTELRETGMQTTRGNGRGTHRLPPRRFDLRYMVSAMTSVVADEHLLLWRALVTLMKHQTLPPELLPPEIHALGVPVTTKVNKPDDAPRALDVWSALEAPPRPSLIYVVTVPVDLDIAIEAPLVLTRTVRYSRSREPEIRPELGTHIGGVVRDRAGAPVGDAVVSLAASVRDGVPTDAEGQFVLTGVPLGSVDLKIERPGRPARALSRNRFRCTKSTNRSERRYARIPVPRRFVEERDTGTRPIEGTAMAAFIGMAPARPISRC
jgi:hypothetical protein